MYAPPAPSQSLRDRHWIRRLLISAGAFPISQHFFNGGAVVRAVIRMLVAGLLLTALAARAEAQRRAPARRRAAAASPRPHLGGHLGYSFETDNLLLGAQLSYPITPRVDLYPSFDFYFIDPGSLWALNFDVRFRPPSRSGAFYVGGGINYSSFSPGGGGGSNSDTNLNLFTGLEGRRPRVWPYVEARLILGDGSAFQLAGGLSWRM